MPNKAKSKAQFRMLQAAAHGELKGDGPSPEQAKEMLGHQSPKGLPERKRKDDDGQMSKSMMSPMHFPAFHGDKKDS